MLYRTRLSQSLAAATGARVALVALGALITLGTLGACGGSSARPAAAPRPVGDLGVDVAGLAQKLPAFIDSVSMGDPNQAFSGYVLVAQHDQPIFSEAYGLADRERRQRATADTSFRVGSVTKQFTAAAILLLEQQGKLSVADPISKYLPEYPAPGRDLTLHQLLTHTSGIPNLTEDPEIAARKAQHYKPDQLLALFWNKPLQFAAGTQFAYSNSGYDVLGVIIERVSGKPYGAFLTDALFTPAGMTRTVFGDAESAIDRAEGYQIVDGKIIPSDPVDMSGPYASGGVRSTANDLVRWHRALSGDQILTAASRAKLYKPELSNYAYGWVNANVEKREVVWHNGGIDGFTTTYWRVPSADLVVVVWSNVVDVSADPIGRAAVEAALGGAAKPLEKVEAVPADAAQLARLTGEYVLTDEGKAKAVEMKLPQGVIDAIASITVTASDTGIVTQPVGQGPFELVPTKDGSFFAPGPQIRMRFELPASPASAPATAVGLEQRGHILRYLRKAQ